MLIRLIGGPKHGTVTEEPDSDSPPNFLEFEDASGSKVRYLKKTWVHGQHGAEIIELDYVWRDLPEDEIRRLAQTVLHYPTNGKA
jgi:hypothetical protein